MADPLSISASLAGLAQLAGTVYIGICKYIKAVRNARDKMKDLATEIRTVSGILQNLSLLAESLSDNHPVEARKASLQAAYLDDCRETISKIKALVEKAQKDFESGKKRDAVVRSLISPLSDDHVSQLLKDMRRHRDTLTLALSADTLDKLLEVGHDQGRVNETLQRLHDVVVNRFEIEMRIELDDHRQKVVEFFLRVNPQSNLDTSLRLRQMNTGEWLTIRNTAFRLWQEVPNSKLWLNGIPGSGKTVLSGAVIQEVLNQSCESTAIAFFFCDYKNANSYHPTNILSALAVQLALQNDTCFTILDTYSRKLHPIRGPSLQKEPEVPDLLAVLSEIVSFYTKTFVVVDALDECGSQIVDVRYLKKFAENPNVSIALFSRDEEEIRDELFEYEEIKIAAHSSDLELYIAAEMVKRRELMECEPETRRKIHDALLKKANGMFRWVVCQIDYLCSELDDQDRLEALEKFPETLNETYDRILNRTLHQTSNASVRHVVRKALLWICHCGASLSIEALCEALSIREDRDGIPKSRIKEGVIMRRCSSLIRKSNDGTNLELAHFTVQEYLRSLDPKSPLGMFRYVPEETAQELVDVSLKFLTFSEFNEAIPAPDGSGGDLVEARNETHPFYLSAATAWVDETRNLENFEAIEMAKILFHPRKKPFFVNWLSQILCSTLGATDGGFSHFILLIERPDFSTLHAAAAFALPEVCKWLCEEHCADVNLKSSVGTPLRSALAGPRSFTATNITQIQENLNFQGSPERIRETIEILLDSGAETTISHGLMSFGRTALSLWLACGDPSPVIPFITRGKGLGADMIEELRCRSGPYFDGKLMIDISANIREAAKEHPHIPEMSSLLSMLELQSLRLERKESAVEELSLSTSRIADEDFQEFVEIAVRYNRADDVKLLMADPRFNADNLRFGEEKQTVIHLAAECDNETTLRMLLDHGIEPWTRDENGMTALHLCSHYQVDSIRLLLARGLSSCIKNITGSTIWHLAAHRGSDAVLKCLQELDNEKHKALCVVSNEGRTPLAVALHSGREDIARLLCDNCTAEPGFFTSDVPVLFLAAKIGSESLFEKLLQKSVNITPRGLDGSNPLHYLSHTATPQFIRYLKSHHYSISDENNDSQSPLETFLSRLNEVKLRYRAQVINPGAIQELLSTQLSSSGTQVWDFFCRNMVSTWVTHGYVSDSAEDLLVSVAVGFKEAQIATVYQKCTGRSVLSPLVKSLAQLDIDSISPPRFSKLLGLFLEPGVTVSDLSNEPCYIELLKRAVRIHDEELVKLLLSKGPCTRIRESGESPIEVAFGGSFSIFKLVLDSESTCIRGHSTVFSEFISELFFRHIPSKGVQDIEKLRYVLERGHFDPNARLAADREVPAIVYAGDTGKFDVVDVLLEYGADLLASDTDGFDIAIVAASCGYMRILRLLLERDYDWRKACRFYIRRPCGNFILGGCNVLHIAAFYGQLDVMKFILDNRLLEDLESLSHDRYTPLHFATMGGRIETIDFLVERGVDLNPGSRNGALPLDLAFEDGRIFVVRHLFSHRAENSSNPRWKSLGIREMATAADGRNGTQRALNLRTSQLYLLESAIVNGSLGECQAILAQHRSLINQGLPKSLGSSPLLCAAFHCKPEIVLWLLRQGARPEKIDCPYQHPADQSSISLAAAFPELTGTCLEPLLKKALEYRISWIEDPINAIHAAVLSSNIRALDLIIFHLRSHAVQIRSLIKVQSEHTYSHCQTDRAIVREILGRPISSFKSAYESPWPRHDWLLVLAPTPLHLAADANSLDAAKALLKLGVNPNATDIAGRTPLHYVRSCELAKCLIDYGADPERYEAKRCLTPLSYHVEHGDVGIAELLVSKGANIDNFPFVENLLHFAEGPEMFSYLVQKGIDPHQIGWYSRTPIHCALVYELDYLPFLLHSGLLVAMTDTPTNIFADIIHTHGGDLDRRRRLATTIRRLCLRLSQDQLSSFLNTYPSGYHSPLCMAVSIDHVSALRVLLEFGAELEMEGSRAGTALMTACARGRLEIVKLLVRRGAQLTYVGEHGRLRSAPLLARQYPDIVQWLLAGRYYEQLRLRAGPADASIRVRHWSGVTTAKFALPRNEI